MLGHCKLVLPKQSMCHKDPKAVRWILSSAGTQFTNIDPRGLRMSICQISKDLAAKADFNALKVEAKPCFRNCLVLNQSMTCLFPLPYSTQHGAS
jgi:hypothetical protein